MPVSTPRPRVAPHVSSLLPLLVLAAAVSAAAAASDARAEVARRPEAPPAGRLTSSRSQMPAGGDATADAQALRGAQRPVWIGSRRGAVAGAAVWCRTPADADAGESTPRRQAFVVATFLEEAAAPAALEFEILLRSRRPAPRWPWDAPRGADAREVKVTEIVLTDGRDGRLRASVAPLHLQGASAPDPSSALDGFWPTHPPTMDFAAGTNEPPAYQARYRVRFSLVDEQGRPRISAAAYELRLLIRTRAGDMAAAFRLPGSPSPTRQAGTRSPSPAL